MHRFTSISTIYRFKFVSILLCLRYLAGPVIIGALVYSILTYDHNLVLEALIVGIATVMIGVLQWLLAPRTRCPLCMTPVLARQRCSKHRNAQTLLGSYRLRVAVAILTRNSFTCPFCHEKSAMEVRVRAPRSHIPHY